MIDFIFYFKKNLLTALCILLFNTILQISKEIYLDIIIFTKKNNSELMKFIHQTLFISDFSSLTTQKQNSVKESIVFLFVMCHYTN